jgi:hypothetical protein
MNANLPRWMFSSMAKHFSGVAATKSLNYYVEGVDEPETQDFQNDTSLFKMDGPVAHQGSKGVEWYSVEIMILLTDIIQLTNDNAYSIYEWAGAFQASMLNDALQVFRYGTGGEDDQTLIGCLEPDPRVKNNVRVVPYGQVDKDLRVKQVSINGRFVLHPL